MFGTMLISMGVLLFIGGLIATIRARATVLEAKRGLAIPSRIADVRSHGGRVQISGTVADGGEGSLVAPCTGATAVWFRVRLLRNAGMTAAGSETSSPMWITSGDEQRAVPFLVDDGSGRVAHVTSVGRGLVVPTVVRTLSAEAMERVARLFAESGGENWMADAYEEQCIRIGDRVDVHGLVHDEPGEPVPEVYRDATSHRLIVSGEHGGGAVVISQAFAKRALRSARASQLAMSVGLCAVVVGVIVRLTGWEWTP